MDGQREVLMIGPVKSGKTCSLATLELAAQKHNAEGGECEVFVRPSSDTMIALFRQCRETIRSNGRFPINASTSSQDYSFTLELTQKGWLNRLMKREKNEIHFSFLDGPGGGSIGGDFAGDFEDDEEIDYGDIEAHREKVIESLRRASGLIICVDANDEEKAAHFFVDLPELLARVNMRTLPVQRISICLTKADRYFVRKGRNALEAIYNESPIPRGVQILTQPGLQALRSYCSQAQITFGWISNYGFVANQGYPNYDFEEDRLLMFEGLAVHKVIEYWEPFRILEPFVYMANGSLQNLKVYP